LDAALKCALRYLAPRARSSAEVKNYLVQRGGTNIVIEATMGKLRALNYIDDEAFARDWALLRAQSRGCGPKKIAQDLETRGIDPSLIRAAVREAFEQEDELERAREILGKQFRSEDLREPRALRRAVAFLERRGYSDKVISALLRHPTGDNC
jgi:regulatory protein